MINRKRIEAVSPLWLGLGIAGALLLILLLSETLLGRWGQLLIGGEFDPLAKVSGGELRDFRIAVVHCLQAGYLPAAFLYVLRSGRRTVFELQGALDCSAEECESLAASFKFSLNGLLIIGAIGLLFAFATPYLVPPVAPAPWSPSSWSPEVAWHRILNPVTSVWSFLLGYAVVVVSMRMSRIAKELNKVDLLDLSPLTPFTQLGLTNALLLVGSLSIWSLMMFETGFRQMSILIGGVTLVSTSFAVLLPVRGVHKRIRQSKEMELNWVNRKISRQKEELQNPESRQPGGRMADLISYQGLVEGVSEWPFTKSTYTRILLYVLLPVMTWGIGILAEEIVDRALF
jgi:hypothetical protein